ncbi:unnamed protein product [Didymodactylos carnosus]|uniref:Retinol dehydrogenase 13 n=1 Tax=Didymodactylos carnosus TaxID=1234261 RepID=A0A813UGR1_9BILA|nr:unnamed protein product [Didymodactylos carnosus]CAF0828915.1 unnamed protein product [Didymodactylos carnosus]CAF3536285.1 unnamed protein product [Didymodactylos carnosus]CAF3615921.1 unnamed protein product [Didymodactylos carnosus]
MKTVAYVLSAGAGAFGALILYRDKYVSVNYKGTEQLLGKTCVITGSNSGIGKEVARDFAQRGARVVMACRDIKKCELARDEIINETNNTNVVCYECDLASIESIKSFALRFNTEEKYLHILVNNAGIMWHPQKLTKDGFELHLGVNYLGHFLLTNLLIDKLAKCSPSRVVNLTSAAHKRGVIDFDDLNMSKKVYNAKYAYEQSELARVLFTREFCRRFSDKGVTSYAVHPGIVRSNISQYTIDNSIISGTIIGPFMSAFMKSSKTGAQNVIYCALDKSIENECGKYYSDLTESKPSKEALNDANAKRLWAISERWTRLK